MANWFSRIVCSLILSVLVVSLGVFGVSAQEDNQDDDSKYSFLQVNLKLVDLNSNDAIKNYPLSIVLTEIDKGTKISTLTNSDENGLVSFKHSPGKWKIMITANNLSTEATDYYTEDAIVLDESALEFDKIVYLLPTGYIEGVVMDINNNLVSGASLMFNCKKKTKKVILPTETNNFGSFTVEHMPIGDCIISAEYKGVIGSIDVKIEQGKNVAVVIKLEKAVISTDDGDDNNELFWFFVGGSFVVLLLVVIFVLKYTQLKFSKPMGEEEKKAKKGHSRSSEEHPDSEHTSEKAETSKKAKEHHEKGLNPRARDIMKTLSERENKVIEHLLANNNKSTQATLRNHTGIPKTSLARIFQNLEQKNVLKVESVGKLKKVELTDWFMGKD
ncbi:hypothetical protein ACFL0W_02350 [Nanoarchaeota archaeon]